MFILLTVTREASFYSYFFYFMLYPVVALYIFRIKCLLFLTLLISESLSKYSNMVGLECFVALSRSLSMSLVDRQNC